MVFGVLAAVAGCCTFCEPEQAPNTLSEKEKADGWQLLWDGKTSAGWVGVKTKCKEFPDHGWQMRKLSGENRRGGASASTAESSRPSGSFGRRPARVCGPATSLRC